MRRVLSTGIKEIYQPLQTEYNQQIDRVHSSKADTSNYLTTPQTQTSEMLHPVNCPKTGPT